MLEVKICHKISEIDADTWNKLLPTDNPFVRYEFLDALESSGSVTAKTGWQPVHLLLQEGTEIIAALPLYLKNHSYGEYVFDWAWADAYHRYDLEYYPKLLSAVPFSPVAGPRLLTQRDQTTLWPTLLEFIPSLSKQLKANSWHLLFPQHKPEESSPAVFQRLGCQYQWFNDNYEDFEDFLASFTSRKRKSVRKERQKVIDQGIRHQHYQGADISDTLLTEFYHFYQMTYMKRGRQAYLTYVFFKQLITSMPENILLVVAYKDEQAVAAALSLQDSTTLYGRYWGCHEEFDSLHFETCYYQGLEYCIAQQLQRFDSGAQGEHKIQRGFKPVPTYSLHWLQEKGFNQAIAQFIDEETAAVEAQIEDLQSYLPFKKEG